MNKLKIKLKMLIVYMIILIGIITYVIGRVVIETKESVTYKTIGDDSFNSTDDFRNTTFPEEFDTFSDKSQLSNKDATDPFKEMKFSNEDDFDSNKDNVDWDDDDDNDDFNYKSEINDVIFGNSNQHHKVFKNISSTRQKHNNTLNAQLKLEKQKFTNDSNTTPSPNETTTMENGSLTTTTVPMTPK
ncbi:unnamed protein product [Schistosoma turkestanicum]|nr:unnamed protein product [Schistosoma turkestanicum]